MPQEFKLPELAESVVEGEIVQWMVAEGDPVEEGQPLVEVMTDKVTVELPSPYGGVLTKRRAEVGEVVPVGQVIAEFDAPGAGDAPAPEAEAAAPASAPAEEAAPGAPEGDASLNLFTASAAADEGGLPEIRKPTGGGATAESEASPQGPWGRPLAVPAARRLARERGIDVARVNGSGPNGRVRVEDVRAHGAAAPAAGGGGPQVPPIPHRTPEGYAAREERMPLRGLRRVTSRHMLASHLHTVRTLHVDEADLTELAAMRTKLKPRAEARGVKLTYLPFVMKALASALHDFPTLNASLDEGREEIVLKRYVHVGMATATDAGLVVPVVRDVERRGLLDLAAETARLAGKARDGTLEARDVEGASFGLTNVGALGGGLFSFPIIQSPQAAILGFHSIKRRPVVDDHDRIVPRTMVYLSLSFDHRLVDGAEAATFTNRLIELLEAPESLLLEA